MATVEFDNVTKSFGDTTVVHDLNLEVIDREFLVLLGPSGCGKSTVLRMIAGLEEPTIGEVRIGGEVMNGVDPRDRDLAMVFQSYALYPHMTVAKNIEAPLLGHGIEGPDGEIRKPSSQERRDRVLETASLLGIEEYLDRKPGALSGGQRQRVALGRAIVRRPQVFLMDEPLSNLDAKLRSRTRLELVDLWRRLQTTVVYVTHDQVEAMTMATRIAIIADGRLQQVGTPSEAYHQPANLFVARFIGSPQINTFDGFVSRDGSTTRVDYAGRAIAVLPRTVAGIDSRRAVTVGVRPEHLRVDDDGAIHGTVRAAEDLGHEIHLTCEIDGELHTVRHQPDGDIPAPGGEVSISIEPSGVHVFDPDSGTSLL